MLRTLTTTVALLALCLLFTSSGYADFILGTHGRQMGMGGAGLALVDRPDQAQYANPAAIAFSSRKYGYRIPVGSLRYEGIDHSQARDYYSEVLNASIDDAAALAREFSSTSAVLDSHASGGVSLGHINAGYEIQGRARMLPDAVLMAWADGGGSDPPIGGAAVLTATVTSWPTLSYGRMISRSSAGRVALGGRIRFQKFHGRSDIVTFDGSSAPPAVVGTGDLNEKGIAFDLGMVMQPRSQPHTSYAVVIDNLVHPSFPLVEQDPLISVGAARTFGGRLAVAADAVNLTNAYGDGIDLRAGVELRLSSYFAARTGVSSRKGLTFGLQLGGIDFAIAGDSPLAISQTLRF